MPARCSPTTSSREERAGGAITKPASTTSRSLRTAERSTWPSAKPRDSSTWEIIDPATGKITGSIQAARPARDDRRSGRQARLPRRRQHPLPRGREHIDRQDRQEGRASPWTRCPSVHDQRDSDAGVHDRLDLPRLSGQQHQTGKVLYSVSPPGFRYYAALVLHHARPRHLPLPRRTSAVPDRYSERVCSRLRRQRPPPPCPLATSPTSSSHIRLSEATARYNTAGTALRLRRTIGRRDRHREPQDRRDLHTTRLQFIEIDWRNGHPVDATSRYCVCYPSQNR